MKHPVGKPRAKETESPEEGVWELRLDAADVADHSQVEAAAQRVEREPARGGRRDAGRCRSVDPGWQGLGGVSQMDTFDYKPALEKLHGEKFEPGGAVEAAVGTRDHVAAIGGSKPVNVAV